MATSRQASKFKAISHEVLGLHQKVSASNPQFRTRKTKKTSLKLLFDDFWVNYCGDITKVTILHAFRYICMHAVTAVFSSMAVTN